MIWELISNLLPETVFINWKKLNFEQIVILLSAILYFSVGVSYLLKAQYAWALVWLAYSTANIGLMIAAKNT
jgi:hypothetical protein